MDRTETIVAQLAQRIEALEADARRVAARGRRWKLIALLALAAATAAAAWRGGPRAQAQQFVLEEGARQPVSHLVSTYKVEAESYFGTDRNGRRFFYLDSVARNPLLTLFAGDQRARLYLTVKQDGEPALYFFDKDGRDPVEVTVNRAAQPSLSVRRAELPERKLIPEDVPPDLPQIKDGRIIPAGAK